jgi:hypothetical protein
LLSIDQSTLRFFCNSNKFISKSLGVIPIKSKKEGNHFQTFSIESKQSSRVALCFQSSAANLTLAKITSFILD